MRNHVIEVAVVSIAVLTIVIAQNNDAQPVPLVAQNHVAAQSAVQSAEPALAQEALQPNSVLRGRYVEARTAAVFAGACHYNSEFVTAGRRAVLGWTIESGRYDGVSLAGVQIAAAVRAKTNLHLADSPRESVVYLSQDLTEAEVRGALAWLRDRQGEVVGKILQVRRTAVQVAVAKGAEGRFQLTAGKDIALAGGSLPNRECCAMPFNIWYEPLSSVQKKFVGRAESVSVNIDQLKSRWSRFDDNCVYFGAFEI